MDEAMNLHGGKIQYEIKKGYIHLYVTDDFKNTVEIVSTKEELKFLLKILLRM